MLPGGGGGGTSTAPAYEQFYSFNGVLTFIRGVLTGSKFAVTGSKMDLCLTSQTVLINGAEKMYDTIYQNFTIYGVLLGIDEGLKVLNGFGSLGTDCIEGLMDIPNILDQYTAFISNPAILQWNIVYNFGLVYNSIKNTVFFFLYPDLNKITTTNALGL